MTEKELIKGCIKENEACQRELFKQFSGTMLIVCRRYARCPTEAHDLLQEGFIKVFDNISRFRQEGSFEGWIRRIMINTALKYYRRISFQREDIGLEVWHDGSGDPEVYNQMSEQEIMKVINELPEGYRLVFNLYVVEGYSHKEIAESLGIGESTSRSQLVKARKLLQQKIRQLYKKVV